MLGIPSRFIPRETGPGGMFITWYRICQDLIISDKENKYDSAILKNKILTI